MIRLRTVVVTLLSFVFAAFAMPIAAQNTKTYQLRFFPSSVQTNQETVATVEVYNTSLRSFPTVLIAGTLGFAPAEFFEVEAKDTGVPKVDFGTAPATSTP